MHSSHHAHQEAIRFMVRSVSVAVPVDAVELIEDVQLATPPPLSQAWIGGIAAGPRMAVCVALFGHAKHAVNHCRLSKVARIKPVPGHTDWSLEIDQTGGLCRVRVHGAEVPPMGWPVPADWFCRASDESGRPMLWLEVRRIQENFRFQ